MGTILEGKNLLPEEFFFFSFKSSRQMRKGVNTSMPELFPLKVYPLPLNYM